MVAKDAKLRCGRGGGVGGADRGLLRASNGFGLSAGCPGQRAANTGEPGADDGTPGAGPGDWARRATGLAGPAYQGRVAARARLQVAGQTPSAAGPAAAGSDRAVITSEAQPAAGNVTGTNDRDGGPLSASGVEDDGGADWLLIGQLIAAAVFILSTALVFGPGLLKKGR